MLKSKTFVKKTRKGGILKIVREHYLRDDVWCGAIHCSNCNQTEGGLLEEAPQSISKLCPFSYYLIPDTNVVLHQVRTAWSLEAMLHVISYEFFWNGLDPCKILSPKFLFIAGCTTVFPVKLSLLWRPNIWYCIDPLHVCGNAANLEDKTKEIFASVKKILLFCTPDWLHSHRRAKGLYDQQPFASF